MITDGFVYIAALIGIAALLIYLPKIWKGKAADMFFSFAPPVVLIYLIMMVLCTLKVWDLGATAPTYSALKNPILYAMVFIMLLRCDMKKIIKLGPKMLIGFFSATLSCIHHHGQVPAPQRFFSLSFYKHTHLPPTQPPPSSAS